MALYFVTFWRSPLKHSFFFYQSVSVCLVQAQQAVKHDCCRPIRPRSFRKSSILWQDGRCCTSVLVEIICRFNSKMESVLPFYAKISMQIEHNSFASLQFLSIESLLHAFLYTYIFTQFGITKHVNHCCDICFTTCWRKGTEIRWRQKK